MTACATRKVGVRSARTLRVEKQSMMLMLWLLPTMANASPGPAAIRSQCYVGVALKDMYGGAPMRLQGSQEGGVQDVRRLQDVKIESPALRES